MFELYKNGDFDVDDLCAPWKILTVMASWQWPLISNIKFEHLYIVSSLQFPKGFWHVILKPISIIENHVCCWHGFCTNIVKCSPLGYVCGNSLLPAEKKLNAIFEGQRWIRKHYHANIFFLYQRNKIKISTNVNLISWLSLTIKVSSKNNNNKLYHQIKP